MKKLLLIFIILFFYCGVGYSQSPSGMLKHTLFGKWHKDATDVTEAQGDVIYFNGTLWTNLGPGVAGQALKTGGAGANPAWGDVGSIATDTIWDAAGDLVQGTGANTAEKLTKGAEGTLLRAGATKNAYTTSTFADTYAKGTFLYAATANTIASLAHPGAANYFLYTTAADTSAWATGATIRTALGLAIGTDVQAYHASLASIAGLTEAANSLPYFTADNAWAVLTSSANMISLLQSADYATARTNLGLAIGSNVQAYDATLASLAALSITEGDLIIGSGADAVTNLDAGTQNYILTMGAARPAWSNTLQIGTLNLPAANADPGTTAGQIVHDTTVTNHANGAVRWWDGTNIRQMVDMVAATAEGCTNAYVVAYDSTNDLFYCKEDATAGAPTLDTIGDPAAATSISMDNDEGITLESAEDTGTVLLIKNTDADLAGVTSLIDLSFNDDGQANGYYMRGYDNAYTDLKWSIGADGAFVTGAITASGAVALNGDATIGDAGSADKVKINLDAVGIADAEWNGTTITLACGEDITAPAPVYIKSDGKAWQANAAAAATMPAIGLMVETCDVDASESKKILIHGVYRKDASYAFTVGSMVYVDDSAAGVLTHTVGDISGTDHVVQVFGVALDADYLLVNPSLTMITLE